MDEEHQLAHDLRIVNSFGVGTARYCSCWPSTLASSSKSLAQEDPRLGTTYVDVPLGCNIVRWDIDRRERVRFFRPHGDIVTCMLKTDDFIFTASEAGEVALWDHHPDHVWRLLDRSHHATRRVKVTHAAVSPCRGRIVTTSEHADGIATLFKVYYSTPEQQLRLVKVLEFGAGAGYTFVEWADSGGGEPDSLLLVAVRQPPRASRRSVEGPSPATTQHSETALHLIRVDERSGEWRVIKERALELPSATRSSAVSVSAMAKEDRPSTDGGPVRMAIALSGRRVEVVDMRTLATLWTVDASGGSGLIKCLAFKSAGDRLLCPGDNARLTVWQRDRLAGEFVLDGLSSGSIYYVDCDDAAEEAWVVNEAGIHSCPLRRPLSSTVSSVVTPLPVLRDDVEAAFEPQARHMAFHAMTCCGLDFNWEGTQVAVGDFAGNVIVWDVGSHLPLASTRVPSLLPVRSICWRRPSHRPDGPAPHVLIGCVSGDIYSWNPLQPDVAPLLVAALGDTVTCMRWEHGDAPRLLAAGTTNGTLHVMRLVVVPAGDHDRLAQQQQLRLEDVLVIEAHRPVAGPQNLQFGSIGLFAEIWSLAWSPDNGAIATCSEDQTTCVWALPGGEKRRTLTGHTTAVTGVDWQLMRRLPAASSSSSAAATATTEEEESEWHEVLATCADDRKVMVWNARTWALMHVFDTSEDIHDWHTLTYCALQPRGDKLCCVTQNGAVAVWGVGDGAPRQRRWVGKLHTGSVEGLAWSPTSDLLATCSSD